MKISRRTFLSETTVAASAAGAAAAAAAAAGVHVLGAAVPLFGAPAPGEAAAGKAASGEAAPGQAAARSEETPGPAKTFVLHPVGHVTEAGEPARIRILEPYLDALLGLDAWSHINVLYWFDRNDTPERRRILRVHPRGNPQNPLTGVFACRSPVRPNLIALSVCELVSVEGPIVTVRRIDALEGTPVLDLKPLIPDDFSVQNLRVPKWAGPPGSQEPREEPKPRARGDTP